MKTFLKFSGLCALVLAAVSLVLMLVSPAITYTATATVLGKTTTSVSYISGIAGIFGKGTITSGDTTSNFEGTAVWSAIIAFVLLIVALLLLLLGAIMPVLKVKSVTKFAGVINLVAVCALAVAGVFFFLEVPTFQAANEVSSGSGSIGGVFSASGTYGLGAGWLIAGILSIAGAVIAILPAAADFAGGKGKKRK
jgi:glucan phosphoethanolaminetransferase (alkaline phosphatase superfamily)